MKSIFLNNWEVITLGIFDRLFRREQRTQVISANSRLAALLGQLEISPETAGEIPAVSACIDWIASCIAGLPVKLYRENQTENTTEEVKDDSRLRLLNDETGDLLDPFQMKQALISDYFLYGAGYLYPEMNGNEVISLRYIRHGNISSFCGTDPVFKYGEYVLSNGMRLRDDEVIRLLRNTRDGMTGESVIVQHQQILSAMYREIIYEKMLVATGGNKKGFITVDDVKITKEAMNALHENWKRLYESTGSAMMILNKGLQFHESSNTSVEMQLNENKAKNNELICQLFRLSPDAVSGKLGDDGMVSAVKSAVIPLVTELETALNRGLLLPSERDLMYFVLDTSELLKGDILKRYQAYKTGLECNVLQIDEARYKEDLPPLGLNWIKLGLQDVLYDPKTKTIYTPNMNQSMQMSENTVNFGKNEVDNAEQDGIMEERTADETRVVCVWGSPLSGKTTYVEKHAKKSDVIWDWDKVKQAVSMTGSHQETEPQTHKMLMRLRASFMRSASDCGAQTAWFICTRPDVFIREMLGSDAEYIKMDVSKEECLRRLEKDDTRPDKQKMAALIEKFFREEGTEEMFREDQARDEHGRFVDEGGSFGDIDGTFKTGGIVRLPDGTAQPRLYSNGGGKLSEEDNRKNQESYEKDVASGRISTKLDKRAQAAHKKGSDAFNKRVANGEIPSYTTRKNMDVQTIINRHNNDGTLYLVNGQYKRVITEPEIVGMFGDRRTNTYLPTKRATIHYSQDGAHLVPAPPKED